MIPTDQANMDILRVRAFVIDEIKFTVPRIEEISAS